MLRRKKRKTDIHLAAFLASTAKVLTVSANVVIVVRQQGQLGGWLHSLREVDLCAVLSIIDG